MTSRPHGRATEMHEAKARIFAQARNLGFDLVGIAAAAPFAQAEQTFKQRRDAGYLERWHYDDATIEACCRPAALLPGAQSIVCTATSYYTGIPPHDPNAPGLQGAISNYAWGRDYHAVIGRRMRSLASFVTREFGAACRACVDTGPMVDRAAAVRAGIGWFGKSGNVLTKEFGSYVFLAELVTTLALPPDRPLQTNCGHCEACASKCPTSAIGPGGAVDARRCLSDLTQAKGVIPREYRKLVGNRLWGCDDCQTACPVNERKTAAAAGSEFAPLPHIGTSMDLPSVLLMTSNQFRRWFGPTPMAWRGKAVLQRNAAVALGNSRDQRAVAPLCAALRDRKALVRGHAAWALGELGGATARQALDELCRSEADAWVKEEAQAALQATLAATRSVCFAPAFAEESCDELRSQ